MESFISKYNYQRPEYTPHKLERSIDEIAADINEYETIKNTPKDFIYQYGSRTTMKAIIKKIGHDYDIEIVELEIPEDHIHMVIRSIPKQSPSDVMQIVKSITAREFFRIYPEIKKRYFWGGKLWTQSYFVETIGNANEETIRKYVQDQLTELDQKGIHSDQLDLF